MPKIEVTDGSTNHLPQTTAGASNNEQKISVAGLGCDLSLDYTSAVKRSSSLSAASSSRKLKEVTRFKTFKTFVESKILSKSDRSLDGPGNDSVAQPPSASRDPWESCNLGQHHITKEKSRVVSDINLGHFQ